VTSGFMYATQVGSACSEWQVCSSFNEQERINFPSADRTLLTVDDRLPDAGVRRIEAILSRQSQSLVRVEVDTSSKNIELLTAIAGAIRTYSADQICLVGGGTLSDVGGLAASLANPSVDVVLCPTTVIAMCDASIGGLTGMDGWGVKNAWSTKHPASLTIACGEWLETLPERHYRSGFAEIIKMLFLAKPGEPDLQWFHARLNDVSVRLITPALEVIAMGAKLRSSWINNEADRGRDLFGHNVGHAIELLTGAPHGEAIAHGMTMEAELALSLGLLHHHDLSRLKSSLSCLSLTTTNVPSIHTLMKSMEDQRFCTREKWTFFLPVTTGSREVKCVKHLLPSELCRKALLDIANKKVGHRLALNKLIPDD
jgi:3-dehydroquinate synthase